MRKILMLLAIPAILGLSYCKKESDDASICDKDWDIETETEYDALLAAYTTYAGNMNLANCNAYKAAFAKYIDALEEFLDCASWTAADKEELQDAIDESTEIMNSISCT